ncbi:MAG: hypothetical protein H7336_08880 [Bacteriovorax sp.]|nr:hypothetical protein [Bacteriovorax sp.]
MINFFLLVSLLISNNLLAQEFSGCGEYIFKGVLKHDEHAHLKMIYVVNEGTKSQMTFNLIERDDVQKLALMLDLPSTFKASIIKNMDGTRGALSFPSEIASRFPNPLSKNETGITKIKNFKCE